MPRVIDLIKNKIINSEFTELKKHFENLLNTNLESTCDTKVLVVARYDESIEWIKFIPSYINIIIYNKGRDDLGSLPSNAKVVSLPNVGRESHTYLHYITTTKYKDLPDKIIFMQADFANHNNVDLDYLINGAPLECSNIIANCHQAKLQDESDILAKMQWKESKWHNTHITTGESLVDFARSTIKMNLFSDTSVKINSGANFAVYKTNIVCHDLQYHQNIYDILKTSNAPIEGHYMERLWDEWANCRNQNLAFQTLVVNLDSASIRWTKTKSQFDNAGMDVNRFSATDGYKVQITNLATSQSFFGADLKSKHYTIEKYIPYEIICNPESFNPTKLNMIGSYNDFGTGLSAGEIGLWCSQKRFWEYAIKNSAEKNNINYYIVFEDDVQLQHNSRQGIIDYLYYLPKDFDIAYIDIASVRSGNIVPIKNNPYVNSYSSDFSSWGTHAMIFSLSGIEKINSINTNGQNYFLPIDIFFWCATTGFIPDVELYHSRHECNIYNNMLTSYLASDESLAPAVLPVGDFASTIFDMGRGA